MSNDVYLVNPGDLASDTSFAQLTGDEGRHAATVKRIAVGESVDVCDGAGWRATGTVTATTKSTVDVSVIQCEYEAEPLLKIVAVQALAKGERSDLAIEALTEIGVDEIIPWQATHSIAKWNDDKGLAKWQRVARESAKQARRSRVPVVAELHTTKTLLERINHATCAFVLHESGNEPLSSALLPVSGEILLIVGPEGGINPSELTAFSDAGARIVRMGNTVLRTSTAGVAAASAILVQTDRWR